MLLLDDDDELAEAPGALETAFVATLGAEGIAAVDERIVRQASTQQYKVARVVLKAIQEGGFDTSHDGCVEAHARRVIALVAAGRLLGFGNLRRPRFSEVCTPR